MSRLEEIKADNETERWTTQERQEKVRWLVARVEQLDALVFNALHADDCPTCSGLLAKGYTEHLDALIEPAGGAE